MIVNNKKPKIYYRIKLYLMNGKFEIEEANATNFHPSQINEIYNNYSIDGDYSFIVSEERGIEKNSIKLIKHHLRGVEKELTFLRKQQDGYKKALDGLDEKIKKFIIKENV